MQGLDREISQKYNMEIKSITPFKDFFVLSTPKGRKILKKTVFSTDRIMFIHGAKEHLFNNDFKNLDRYLCGEDGSPYFTFDGSNFVITESIEGRECNFDSSDDISCASKLLAQMHKSSKGYVAPENCITRDDLGKLPMFFVKRLEELKKLKKVAKKGKTKFDYLFLENFDYFYNLGDISIKQIAESQYDKIAEATRSEGIFCHHDFTHHNIVCSEGSMFLLNFDFCCFELKIYDVANFIRRKMRKCNWDINEAKKIIDEYRKVEPISEDEFLVLKIILQFPQKFWRVINKYYNSKRSWSERSFILKLQEVLTEIEYHKQFMEKFEVLL